MKIVNFISWIVFLALTAHNIFLATMWMLSLIFQTVNMIHFNLIVQRATTILRIPLLQRAAKIKQLMLMYEIRKVACFDPPYTLVFGDAENMLLAILMINVTFSCNIMTLCLAVLQFRTNNE